MWGRTTEIRRGFPRLDSRRRDFQIESREEKRPAGITPPAFLCNCRLGRSGSAAIPCLKLHHRIIKKILMIDCELHHGGAKPFAANFVPIGAARSERRRP